MKKKKIEKRKQVRTELVIRTVRKNPDNNRREISVSFDGIFLGRSEVVVIPEEYEVLRTLKSISVKVLPETLGRSTRESPGRR